MNNNTIFHNLAYFLKKSRTWHEIEYFDESWKDRISIMSRFIPNSASVMDLGCGKMWLREFLKDTNKYYPVDYKRRDTNTLIYNFNDHEFPSIKVDVTFVSGCLEYIYDFTWFIYQISYFSQLCILSYCTIDLIPSIFTRESLSWTNNLSRKEIILLFKKVDMILINEMLTNNKNHIFVFKSNKKMLHKTFEHV